MLSDDVSPQHLQGGRLTGFCDLRRSRSLGAGREGGKEGGSERGRDGERERGREQQKPIPLIVINLLRPVVHTTAGLSWL